MLSKIYTNIEYVPLNAVIFQLTQLNFVANWKGQSKQKMDHLEELVEKLQEDNKASLQEISKIEKERNQYVFMAFQSN